MLDIATIIKISSYDINKKKCEEEMKICVSDTIRYCSRAYFLLIGEIKSDFLDWLENLPIDKKITQSNKTYGGEGWNFDWTASSEDLLRSIDKKHDWIIAIDADSILPPNIIEEINKADLSGCDMLDAPVLECKENINNVICDFTNYPIWQHVFSYKWCPDLTYLGSSGFSKVLSKNGRDLKIYNSQYPVRHTRYMNERLMSARKEINYCQEFFFIPHKTEKYDPEKKWSYYLKKWEDEKNE